jgi:opacity protein-like surface antigen
MKSVVAAAFSVALAGTASAADLPMRSAPAPMMVAASAPSFFIDGAVGVGYSDMDTLRFINPIGTAFTTNPTVGDQILLQNTGDKNTSFAAMAGVGYRFANGFYAKASYRYFGEFGSNGFAGFGGFDFDQRFRTEAHGALLGLGYMFDLTSSLYLDASIDVGAAFLRNRGTQGVNLGLNNTFPSRNKTTFAIGGNLGLGYRLTQSMDLTLTGSYHRLGKAETGVTPVGVVGMNPGEQLRGGNLDVFTGLVGVRFKM